MSETDPHPTLSPTRYLAERVDTQLRWYGDKSASAKRWYQRLQLLTLVLAAAVPVLALSSGDVRMRIVVALLGAATAIVAGLLALYRFGERWTDYRSTAEAIKHEKFRYLCGATPYVGAEAFSLFVNRVESIILQENRAWREKNLVDEDATASAATTAGDAPATRATRAAPGPGQASRPATGPVPGSPPTSPSESGRASVTPADKAEA